LSNSDYPRFPLLVIEHGDPTRLLWCDSLIEFQRCFFDYNSEELATLTITDFNDRAVTIEKNGSSLPLIARTEALSRCEREICMGLLKQHALLLGIPLGSIPKDSPSSFGGWIYSIQLARLRRGRFTSIIAMVLFTLLGATLALPFKGLISALGFAIMGLGWAMSTIYAIQQLRRRCPCCTKPFFSKGPLLAFSSTVSGKCLHCDLPLKGPEPPYSGLIH
jgi:hypothetical protein